MTVRTMEELAEMCKTSISNTNGVFLHRLAVERMEGMARCLYSLGMVEDARYVREMIADSDDVMFKLLMVCSD